MDRREHIQTQRISTPVTSFSELDICKNQIEFQEDKINLLEAVCSNLKAKLFNTIENTSLILTAFQNYESKTKDQMENLSNVVNEKLESINSKVTKLKKDLAYFKENSTRVNYFYNKLMVKKLSKFTEKIKENPGQNA